MSPWALDYESATEDDIRACQKCCGETLLQDKFTLMKKFLKFV